MVLDFNTFEPVTKDHLSWETTFLCPKGWSFKTGSTVSLTLIKTTVSNSMSSISGHGDSLVNAEHLSRCQTVILTLFTPVNGWLWDRSRRSHWGGGGASSEVSLEKILGFACFVGLWEHWKFQTSHPIREITQSTLMIPLNKPPVGPQTSA